MIPRNLQAILEDRLRQFPAVALLGPRQVGKTTLARVTAGTADSLYLDLENPIDRAFHPYLSRAGYPTVGSTHTR